MWYQIISELLVNMSAFWFGAALIGSNFVGLKMSILFLI